MALRIPTVDDNGLFPPDVEDRLAGMVSKPGPPGAGVPEGGAPLQMIRKTSAGNTTEWVTPTKSMVGLSRVDNTTDAEKPLSKLQAEALLSKADLVDGKVPAAQVNLESVTPTNGARPVGKGELAVNVRDYGARGNGSDDTAAIQEADAAANAGSSRPLYFPNGTYDFNHTITAKTVIGENRQRTLLRYRGGASAFGAVPGQIAYDRKLMNFTLEGQGAGVGLDLDAHPSGHFENILINKFAVGVWLRDTTIRQIPLYNTFINVGAINGGTGFRVEGTGHENKFIACRVNTMAETGWDIVQAGRNVWEAGCIEGCATGVKIIDPTAGMNLTRANVIAFTRFENNVCNIDIAQGVEMTAVIANRYIGGTYVDKGAFTLHIDTTNGSYKGANAELDTIKTASIQNKASFGNGRVSFGNGGVTIDRNSADNNPTLRTVQVNPAATGNVHQWETPLGMAARISSTGHFGVRTTQEPGAGVINTGEAMFWLDSTNGSAKLMVKAKQADGAVKIGSIPLI